MDIMIDIETLGTRPGSVITSVGAVAFCPLRSVVIGDFYETISIADCMHHGLTIDPNTLTWWLKQEKALLDETLSGSKPLRTVLTGLRAFIEGVSAEQNDTPKIWANSPNFDVSLLEAAYIAVGYRDFPWAYRDLRDVRTILDLTGVDLKMAAFWIASGPKHNGLADAKAQARAVIEAYHRLETRKAA